MIIFLDSNNASYTLTDSGTIVPDSLINISTVSSTVWSGFDLSTENPLTIFDRSGLHGPPIDRTENEAVNLTGLAEVIVENKEKMSDTSKLRGEYSWQKFYYLVIRGFCL